MDLLKMIFSQVDESNVLGALGSAVGAEPSQMENLMKIGACYHAGNGTERN